MGLEFPRVLWHQVLSYKLGGDGSDGIPARDGRSLCRYILDNANDGREEIGMRAYVDAVFRTYYQLFLRLWALTQTSQTVRERTLMICFEDLSSSTNVTLREATANRLLNFLYNGTISSNLPPLPNAFEDVESHATSHDPGLRQRLTAMIQSIDQKYYNEEIAWLVSKIPCQD